MELETGQVIAERYEVLGRVGSDANGEVYRVRDRQDQDVRALKVIHDAAARNAILLETFRRQVRVARALDHPNLARVYELGDFQGSPFLVTELVVGESLAYYMARNGPISAEILLPIAGQICAALDSLHRQNIIHRDVKPASFAFGPDGSLKLRDFGMARELEGQMTIALPGAASAHLSPEQLLGRKLDPRSDIYSAGRIFFELLAGRPPHTGIDVIARYTQPPPVVTKFAPDTPPHVAKAIDRCLQPEMEQRFDSILEVLDALNGSPEDWKIWAADRARAREKEQALQPPPVAPPPAIPDSGARIPSVKREPFAPALPVPPATKAPERAAAFVSEPVAQKVESPGIKVDARPTKAPLSPPPAAPLHPLPPEFAVPPSKAPPPPELPKPANVSLPLEPPESRSPPVKPEPSLPSSPPVIPAPEVPSAQDPVKPKQPAKPEKPDSGTATPASPLPQSGETKTPAPPTPFRRPERPKPAPPKPRDDSKSLQSKMAEAPGKPAEVVRTLLAAIRRLNEIQIAGNYHAPLTPTSIRLKPEGLEVDSAPPPEAGKTLVVSESKYLAPECLFSRPAEPKAITQSDIYSLGVISYEWLLGQELFAKQFKFEDLSQSSFEWMRWHGDRAATLPAPNELGPWIPAALSKLVQRMLAKDAAQRPASYESVIQELEEIRHRIDDTDHVINVPTIENLGGQGKSKAQRFSLGALTRWPGILLLFLVIALIGALVGFLLRD